jgi:hypothetical protein
MMPHFIFFNNNLAEIILELTSGCSKTGNGLGQSRGYFNKNLFLKIFTVFINFVRITQLFH